MPPEILIRSQVEEISERIITSLCRDTNFENILYLNLFDNKIKKMKGLSQLVNLKTLILSFNEIEEIEGI